MGAPLQKLRLFAANVESLWVTPEHTCFVLVSEATKEHGAVCDEILPLAHLADSLAAVETTGHILSVSHASGAEDDCCAAVFGRKTNDNKCHLLNRCYKVNAR